jgi:hypothetical protein
MRAARKAGAHEASTHDVRLRLESQAFDAEPTDS